MDPVAAHLHGQVGGPSDSDAGERRPAPQAAGRHEAACVRDLAALVRDKSAELRDREAEARDAIDCATAAKDRTAAAADREAAARDREHAIRDRLAAQRIRYGLVQQLAIAHTDQLTGARTRAAGLGDIDREIDRARRTSGLLVATYVDVVGLKVVNDAYGHAAGDALLARVVRKIRSHLRTDDVIVRLGGDEFLCAMPGATIQDAHQRFGAIRAALAGDPDPSHIKCGFAELGRQDGTAELIGRADAQLPISAPR